MPPRKRPSEGDSEALHDSIERLNEEVRVLRDVLDELRSDLQWAIQNGRVIIIPLQVPVLKAAAGDETAAPPAERPAAPPGQLF